MRKRLVVLSASVAAMVVIAFVIPLAALVHRIAEERAVEEGRNDLQLVVAGLAVSRELSDVQLVVSRTTAGAEGRLGVHFPDGAVVGGTGSEDDLVATVFADPRASTVSTADGTSIVVPVALGTDQVVVRVDIPQRLLRAGVTRAWVFLAVVGVLLVAGAAFVADRLARGITEPMQGLEAVSRRLAAGDLAGRAEPVGPPETVALGLALNHLAERVDALLLAEREEVADLAHRLRTPLAALRLRVELLDDEEARAELLGHSTRVERAVTDLIVEARRRPDRREEPIDLVAAIEERVAWWEPLADDTDMRLEVVSRGATALVTADREDLDAVLDVLIENLFAHVGHGTGRFSVDGVDGGIRLRCDDDGPGVEPDAVSRGASADSTGLGLDIARDLAEQTGGRFSVGSRPGGGGRIELWFPPARSVVERT